jgi:hypothetical protein
MRPIDYLKALGVAIGLMVVNVIIAILAVVIYSYFIDPGHESEYYEAAAPRIVRWPIHIVGTAFFLLAGYWFAKRRPQRNGLFFAATFTALYLIIDAAVVSFKGIWNIEFALAMLANLIAALAGALLAARSSAAALSLPDAR